MPSVAAVEKSRFSNGTLAAVSEQLQVQMAAALAPVLLAKMLLAIPEVESVHVDSDGGMFHVWTIIDTVSESVFNAIYAREKELIQTLQPFRFDFQVVAREGRALTSFITLNCQMAWQK